jgi:hypothetical protein
MVTITSSHPNSVTIASSVALRLRCLAGRIHSLGPRPLYELFCELSASPTVIARLETYASLDFETLDRFGGQDLPTLRLVK